jgi:hypothetical protein
MQQNKEIISQWGESAPYWEKNRAIIHEMFAPVTQTLIEEAGITSRHVVLDIATGPGEPALSIADVVGPEGKVVGTDVERAAAGKFTMPALRWRATTVYRFQQTPLTPWLAVSA